MADGRLNRNTKHMIAITQTNIDNNFLLIFFTLKLLFSTFFMISFIFLNIHYLFLFLCFTIDEVMKMYTELDTDSVEGYLSDEVLNPQFIFPTFTDYILYYQYFKKLNKPPLITSLIGIEVQLPLKLSISSFFQKDGDEIKELFQINKNQPLKIKHNIFLFIVFNTNANILINTLTHHISKSNIFQHHFTFGIFICHPLTPPNDFISLTRNQLDNTRTKNCLLSVKDSSYLELR